MVSLGKTTARRFKNLASMKIAIVYLLAVLVAEFTTVVAEPSWAVVGITLHIIILITLVLHSALARNLTELNRQLVLSLALVPLVRIISLSLPLTDIPQTLWYPLVYIPLAAAAVTVMRIPGYKASDIGLRAGFIPGQLGIAASGLVFGTIEFLILRPQPMVAEFTWQAIWAPALIFLLFVGFVEELIFRGVLQKTAMDAFGTKGMVYVSVLFAILHMGYHSWVDVLFVLGVGLFFGWVVKRTGSLLGVTLSHGITNTLLYLVIPFLF